MRRNIENKAHAVSLCDVIVGYGVHGEYVWHFKSILEHGNKNCTADVMESFCNL